MAAEEALPARELPGLGSVRSEIPLPSTNVHSPRRWSRRSRAITRRVIECGNPETMQLVYRKLQGVRAEYAEQVTAQALTKLDAEANAAARSRT